MPDTHTSYLWIGLIPTLLLAGWILAEWRRQRRLRAFGDPAVVGIRSLWPARFAILLLFLLGVSSAAAILPVSGKVTGAESPSVPEVLILLDALSLEQGGDPLWDSLESAVQEVVGVAGGMPVGVLASGAPPETVVPPTLEGKGLEIVVARLRHELALGGRPGLSAALVAFSRWRQGLAPEGRLVVATAMAVEDLERIPDSVYGGAPGIGFVRLAQEGAAAEYGYRSGQGKWSWDLRPAELGATLQRRHVLADARRLSTAQWLALFAALLLGGESLAGMVVRAAGGGGRDA